MRQEGSLLNEANVTSKRFAVVGTVAILVLLAVAATAAAGDPPCLHFHGNPFC